MKDEQLIHHYINCLSLFYKICKFDDVGLNTLSHTQHNEGAGDCNECRQKEAPTKAG